jgi:hypothetical protein
MVTGMAKRKVTFSLDPTTVALAERAAKKAGLSVSAWMDAAARREAVRTGAAPEPFDPAAEALQDETERTAAEADVRAAG